jgi:hypothetical protein
VHPVTIVVLLCTFVILVCLAGTIVYSSHLSGERRAEQVAGCERANVQRRYINAIVVELDMSLPPIPIPVCEDIIR